MDTLAAIVACHNRRAQTLQCLESLAAAAPQASLHATPVLIDDGSSDGTADAVRVRFPCATVLEGDGTLYWSRAMGVAYGHALARRFDYYLWLNDDVDLKADGLAHLIATSKTLEAQLGRPVIVVGSTWDPSHACTSYGGYVRPRRPTLKNRRVEPGGVPLPCDTMNGNCVLIPHAVAETVGNMDPAFVHTMGDLDYGLRARRLGVGIWIAPGHVATCIDDRKAAAIYSNRALSFTRSVAEVWGPKALPPGPWLVYTRRHGGVLWPLLWLSPYVKVLGRSLWNYRAR